MAKLQQLKTDDPRSQTANIGDRAIDNLAFIRETMERATHFTAVPGYGGVLMGITAVAAAYVARSQPLLYSWLEIWFAEAGLAFAIGLLAMWQKAKISGGAVVSTPAKKFAMGFVPPLIGGIVITLGMWRFGQFELMPAAWMLTYGAAVVCGGAYSVRVVPIMGWFFMALGAIACAMPNGYGDWMMAASFGVTHIVFGLIIAKRYGG